jgi:hypothetical protein
MTKQITKKELIEAVNRIPVGDDTPIYIHECGMLRFVPATSVKLYPPTTEHPTIIVITSHPIFEEKK